MILCREKITNNKKAARFDPFAKKKQESQSAKFKTGMFGPGRVEVGAGSV